MYQFRKLVTRHKLPFALLGVIFLAISTFAVLAIVQAGRIADQRDRAIEAETASGRRFDDLRELTHSFIFDVHDQIVRLPGSMEARRMIVTTALSYLDTLRAENEDDSALLLQIAEGYLRIGDIQGGLLLSNIGDLEGCEKSYRTAMALLEKLEAVDPDDVEMRNSLHVAHRKIGTVYFQRQEFDKAEQEFDLALDIGRTLADEGHRESFHEIHTTLYRKATMQRNRGRLDEAISLYDDSWDTVDRLLSDDPDSTSALGLRASDHSQLGKLYLLADRREEAFEQYERALQLREELIQNRPNDSVFRSNLAIAQTDLGDYLLSEGSPEEALELFRSALQIHETNYAADTGDMHVARVLAVAHERIGGVLSGAGDFDSALQHYQDSLHFRELVARADVTNLTPQRELTVAYEKLGNLMLERSFFDDALIWYGKSFDVRLQLASTGEVSAQSERDLAVSQFKMGETHGLYASQESVAVDVRVRRWQAARSMFEQSLQRVNDMAEAGILSPSDAGIPDMIAQRITMCDTAITELEH